MTKYGVFRDYVCIECYPELVNKKTFKWRAGWKVSRNINSHKRLMHNNKEIEVIIFKKDKDDNITSKVERR